MFLGGLSTKLEILQDFDEITDEDLTEAEELSTIETSRVSQDLIKETIIDEGMLTDFQVVSDHLCTMYSNQVSRTLLQL